MPFERGKARLIGVGTYQHIAGADVPQTVEDASQLGEVPVDPRRCGYHTDNISLVKARLVRPSQSLGTGPSQSLRTGVSQSPGQAPRRASRFAMTNRARNRALTNWEGPAKIREPYRTNEGL